MTYAKKTLSEIKLIHGNYGNFIKGQKLDKKKEKKYKTPPYQDLAASNEIDGEPLDEKCWPGYEKKGMKTMFGKRYPNCVKKKKTRKEEFSDWRSELEQIEEKKMTKAQIKKRDEIADAISTREMNKRYGDKNVKYAIATKLAMKEDKKDVNEIAIIPALIKAAKVGAKVMVAKKVMDGKKEKEEKEETGPTVMVVKVKEELDKKDKPFVKKLVGKLRKGSKTHAKQADDLEKAMNEGMGNVVKKLAKTVGKKVGSGAKTLGKVADDPVKSLGMGAAAGGAGAILINQRKEINRRNRRNNPTVEENVNLKFHLGGNKKEISLNYGNTPIAYKKTEKYKSKTSPNAAINKALVKFKKKDDFTKKNIGEDITDEALTIQNWNVDDIKFTEIETVDIIKAKPLKENVNLDEGIKRKIIKKLAKKIAKQLGKNKPKVTGDVKKYVPPSKEVVQNIQTKSIVNQVKKASDLSPKPVKGTKPVKVDVSKPINFDKYFGGSPTKSVKKKFGSSKPTGTFTDDAPKVKRETLIKAKPGEAAATEKLIKKYEIGDKIEKKYPGRENAELKKKMYKRLFGESNWREELGEDWQKVNRKDKTDGLSKAAVKAYRRENPGSKLQTAVTKDPKKLKKGSKSAKRRLSFCRRMKGMKKKLTSAKTRRDPDSRINKALRRWNC